MDKIGGGGVQNVLSKILPIIFQKKISKFDKKFYVQNRGGGGVQNVLTMTEPN